MDKKKVSLWLEKCKFNCPLCPEDKPEIFKTNLEYVNFLQELLAEKEDISCK